MFTQVASEIIIPATRRVERLRQTNSVFWAFISKTICLGWDASLFLVASYEAYRGRGASPPLKHMS